MSESFEDVFEALAKEATDLLVQKQRGYGPKNIEELGFHGVFSRLASDKINRLRNLMNGTVVKGHVVLDFSDGDLDESVEDTLLDIANYALILLALKRGLWGRPLRSEFGASSISYDEVSF
jgi:hypothetical protein